MSANLDLVRSIFAAYERGDYSRTDWADPQIEYVITDGPAPGSWTGLARMAEASRDWVSAWRDWHAEAEEYRELDGQRVLVLLHTTARGKTSGVEIDQMRANLFHIRGGKVTRIVAYWDRDRALADLGLAPEGDPA